jgi:hypothetical protein
MLADPKTRARVTAEQPRLPLVYYEQTVRVPPGWDAQRHVIVTDTALPPAGRLAVLLHEAAHAVLHRELQPGEYQSPPQRVRDRSRIGRVIANLLGLDTDASSISYVAGWSHTHPTVLAVAATNVLRAVNTIAAGLGLDDLGDEISEASTAA